LKFENTEVWGFKHALRGMRNPKNSWNKSDSYFDCESCFCNDCVNKDKEQCDHNALYIGESDMKLAQSLIRGGSEHRKFLRQIFVSVDITAPLYWWKEFDTYKVGTVANSTSTMHRIQSNSITIESFEIDDYQPDFSLGDDGVHKLIAWLEGLRLKYIETKEKEYWKELIRWLPESWLQTRTVTLSYENIYAICSKGQRRFHKLNEWSGQDNPKLTNFISWARELPYAQEFIFIDEMENDNGE